MNAIFYFSSTGNSLDIVKRMHAIIGGDVHSIPKYHGNLNNYNKIIIVSPIYAFALPSPTENFILSISSEVPVYIILTYGGIALSAPYYAYKVAMKNNINIHAVYKIKMPNNFTLFLNQPVFFINSALKKSQKRLKNIALSINENKKCIPKKSLINLEKLSIESQNGRKELAKSFNVSNSCVYSNGCARCIIICPVNNVYQENGKILFGDNCVGCLGCYHNCPTEAINYKNMTKNKKRYINPNIDIDELL